MGSAPMGPPGWYPDDDGIVRWWDGAGWTDKMQDRPAPPAQTPPPRPRKPPRETQIGLWAVVILAVVVLALILFAVVYPGNKSHSEPGGSPAALSAFQVGRHATPPGKAMSPTTA